MAARATVTVASRQLAPRNKPSAMQDSKGRTKKRKRTKQSQPRSLAVGSGYDGNSHETRIGDWFRRQCDFVIGTESPPPSSRLQLTGLDDQQRSAALSALEKFGLVHFTDVALPSDFLAELRSRASELSEQIENALARRGIQYQHSCAHSTAARAIEDTHSFKFKEVASRCLGRLDIRHGMQSEPFTDGLLTHNPRWR